MRMAPDAESRNRIAIATHFLKNAKAETVPDPYYGDAGDFEYVITLLEDIADSMLEFFKAHRQ